MRSIRSGESPYDDTGQDSKPFQLASLFDKQDKMLVSSASVMPYKYLCY